MGSTLQTLAWATAVAGSLGVTAASAQEDSMELLSQDLQQAASEILDGLEVARQSARLVDKVMIDSIATGIRAACDNISNSTVEVEDCAYGLLAISGLTEEQKDRLQPFADRYRELQGLDPLPETTITETIVTERYAEDIQGYLTSNCANGFNPTAAQKTACNTATVTVAYSIGQDAETFLRGRGFQEAADVVEEACETGINNANGGLVTELFAQAESCYHAIIEEIQDGAEVSWNPTAVNSALNHTLRMQRKLGF